MLSARMMLGEPIDMFKYSGIWNEVASYKVGYPSLSADMCLNSRGIYEYDPDRDETDVQLGCKHLNGRVTAVKGVLRCPVSKGFPITCSVRFPSAQYVPPSMYRILETDYESYALVEGSDDKSFVQILSRYSRPGLRFIEAQKEKLKAWGYDLETVHIEPVTADSEKPSL